MTVANTIGMTMDENVAKNDLLKDLEAVALLAKKATPGDWVWRRDAGKPMLINGLMFGGAGPDGQPNDAAFIIALVNLFRTHHAEIADMAKRVEVAERTLQRCKQTLDTTSECWRLDAERLEAAERDAARWRHARKLLTVDDIGGAQGSYDSFGRLVSENECKRADDAIDAAMHNSAREDGE